MTATDVYESMERGVIDGYTSLAIANLPTFGLASTTPYLVDPGIGSYASSIVVINSELLEKMADKPAGPGWNPARIARAWPVLMQRLGYINYVAQGGDWGSFVVGEMGLQAPPGLLGIHTNLPHVIPADVSAALV